jgi:26S proteasome regulatory subunit N2
VLSFLEENDVTIKIKALEKLFTIVDVHWAEVCDGLTIIEELSEDSSFPAADLAAAIASKCFYHLQSYGDSLKLALSAGKYLDISVKSEYVDTLIATCIDEYKSLRVQAKEDGKIEENTIDPRMENIIEQMFKRCYNDGCFEQAVGIALGTYASCYFLTLFYDRLYHIID